MKKKTNQNKILRMATGAHNHGKPINIIKSFCDRNHCRGFSSLNERYFVWPFLLVEMRLTNTDHSAEHRAINHSS